MGRLAFSPSFRSCLRRAVYARTKFVLLDDPLSAVVSSQDLVTCIVVLAEHILQYRTAILLSICSKSCSWDRY